MKKLFAMLAIMASVSFMSVYAQDEVAPISEEAVATEQVAEEAAAPAEEAVAVEEVAAVEEQGGIHQALKTKFIEGGAGFMSTVALCLILGLAIAIERIIYLSLATSNSKKLLATVWIDHQTALAGGVFAVGVLGVELVGRGQVISVLTVIPVVAGVGGDYHVIVYVSDRSHIVHADYCQIVSAARIGCHGYGMAFFEGVAHELHILIIAAEGWLF